jgi:hypothetical protein
MTQAGEDCYAALVRLDALWDRGRGESEDASALRDRVDVLWGRMTPGDRLEVDGLLGLHRRAVLSSRGD